MKKLLLAVGLAAIAWVALADELKLKNDFPQTYVVKKGDTLWDIAAKYLKNPWLWPKLWQSNQQVDNPNLIYPGDKLSLVIINGQPRLVRKPLIKLSPTARVIQKKDAIPTLPTNLIRAFLTHQQIIDADTLKDAPRITGSADLTKRFTQYMDVYARGKHIDDGRMYGVYRKGRHYVDPKTGDSLGTEAILVSVVKAQDVRNVTVGEGEDAKHYNIASLKVEQVEREMSQGDYLLPLDHHTLPVYFQPHAPALQIKARIIDSSRKTRALGRFDVVVLNKGSADGLEPGTVLRVMRDGSKVFMNDTPVYEEDASSLDRLTESSDETITQPSEEIGQLMVFRTFNKLSLGLILKAEKPIREQDLVTNPE